MKRILTALLVFVSSVSFGTTLNPVQLLNPAGSTAGQAIISSGASSAPAWGSISATALTGIVPVANGGTNASTASGTSLDNITGFSSTGFLTRIGAGTYSFQSLTNGITLSNIAQIAANTLLGNATGSTANVTAVTVTGCNGAAQALQWTNGSGFGCNSSVATSGANANITSLSGLTTALSVAQGGTGRQTLTAHGVLVGEGTSAINQLAVGTTGQVLVGATGADPAFGSSVGALTFTGAITPSSTAGIVGTTTNDNANAGSVGEFINPAATTGTSLTNNVTANCASTSFTAGDWDIQGIVQFVPAGSTILINPEIGISTTSATLGSFDTTMQKDGTNGAGLGDTLVTPVVRESFSTTTTVYLVASAGITTSTATCNGRIRGRRIR